MNMVKKKNKDAQFIRRKERWVAITVADAFEMVTIT